MSSGRDRRAVLATFSKLFMGVALALGVLLAAVLLGPAPPAPARLCAVGSALGLATLIGWRIALWHAPGNSSTGIGFPWCVGLLRVVVVIETGLAGYLATASFWRICFLALAALGAIRGLWILGLTVSFIWGERTRARQDRKR
jgi:hypothetical protein